MRFFPVVVAERHRVLFVGCWCSLSTGFGVLMLTQHYS